MADIKIDPAAIKAILKSRNVQNEMNRRANKVAAKAKADAPVKTGEYRNSIKVRENPTPNRARTEVVAESGHSIFVEVHDRVLGRAIDEARG